MEAMLISGDAEDKLRREQMNDPKVQSRIKQIFEDAAKEDSGQGISPEELPDFLADARTGR